MRCAAPRATFGDVNLDLAHSDQQLDCAPCTHDDRLTFSGDKSWSHFGFQYDFGIEGTQSVNSMSLQRTGALTMTESLRSLSLFETLQATSTSQTSGFAAQRQLALGASRPLLGGSIAYQFSRNESAGGLGSEGAASAQSLSFRRAIGKKLDAEVTQAFQTSTNNGVAGRLTETSLALVRRLSNVVAVQVSADRFHQTGARRRKRDDVLGLAGRPVRLRRTRRRRTAAQTRIYRPSSAGW